MRPWYTGCGGLCFRDSPLIPSLRTVPSALPARVSTHQKQPALNRWTAKGQYPVNQTDSTPTLELLEKLKTQMPEIWGQAEVVGQWVWLEFATPPLHEVR